MSDSKFLSMKEFYESGLLQEVNRQFFHPRGLAMFIVTDDNRGEYLFGGILDSRDDNTGCHFSEFDDDVSKKASYVYMLQKNKEEAREATLGYIIQPLPE